MAYELGMISNAQHERVLKKQQTLDEEIARLAHVFKTVNGKGASIAQLICRPDFSYDEALAAYPELVTDFGSELNGQIEMHLKYAGYIERQKKEVAKLENLDVVKIPRDFAYDQIVLEADPPKLVLQNKE